MARSRKGRIKTQCPVCREMVYGLIFSREYNAATGVPTGKETQAVCQDCDVKRKEPADGR